MKAPQPFVPTRRELVLLAGLLCTLFFITQSEFFAANQILSRKGRTDAQIVETSVVTSHSYPEQKLTWTNSIPETKVVAHVPGESYLGLLSLLGYLVLGSALCSILGAVA